MLFNKMDKSESEHLNVGIDQSLKKCIDQFHADSSKEDMTLETYDIQEVHESMSRLSAILESFLDLFM